VLYLGEINDSQRAAWIKQIEIFDAQGQAYTTAALFPEDRLVPAEVAQAIQIRLGEFEVQRPRQWGACWLTLWLWELLGLDQFWSQRLPPSREGTRWHLILAAATAYQFIEPGSEWRLHRHWFGTTALADLLGPDFSLGCKDNLYRCLDRLLAHKRELFSHLRQRWADLFAAKFDVLLYDLTSTYFESDPPWDPEDIRRFGHSRDRRSDCVQVVLAVVLTPEGYPIGYEVLPGNTADITTLSQTRKKIEEQYGAVERIWLMDRGIPTEDSLAAMRASQPPVRYLVGTPKGRLTKLEKKLAELPWAQARYQVQVKLLPEGGEVYILVNSQARVDKERAMRRRRLKRLWARLKELRAMKELSRDDLLKKLAEISRLEGDFGPFRASAWRKSLRHNDRIFQSPQVETYPLPGRRRRVIHCGWTTCFCVSTLARRMAKSTATGVSSRTAACGWARRRNAQSFTLVRSMTTSRRPGARAWT
jgi:hypothetical protein